MSESIQPALTPEEWRDGKTDGAYFFDNLNEVCIYAGTPESSFRGKDRHALAALCLYQQRFGFTWQDVWNLRSSPALELHHIADRIAALLPPEPKGPSSDAGTAGGEQMP